jgi:hypothetical protein
MPGAWKPGLPCAAEAIGPPCAAVEVPTFSDFIRSHSRSIAQFRVGSPVHRADPAAVEVAGPGPARSPADGIGADCGRIRAGTEAMWRYMSPTALRAEYRVGSDCDLPEYLGSTLRGVLRHELRAVTCMHPESPCSASSRPSQRIA